MEQTTRRFKAICIKTLVCLLCFALIFTASPVFTIAETNNNSLIPNVEETTSQIMYEVVDDRTANQKVFRMDDGSYMTAQYEYDIHYQESYGWENIDNTLIESAANDSADFAGVEAENGKRAVKFANNTSSGKVLRIKNGDAKIVWTVPNANKSTGKFKQPEASKESADANDKYLRLNKSVSQATYSDVWNNVDLRYTVMGSSIKEEIIIKKALDGYDFGFELELKKSSLLKNADGSLTISDTDGNELYTIPAPFMSDASGRYSEAVEYDVTVISEKNNKVTYKISVVADKDWINSDDTVFPVVVDPTVTMHKSSMFSINDYSVSSASPNHTDNSDVLYIGNSADKGICRTYIKFNNIDVPKKPADKLVGLYLRLTSYADTPHAGAIEMYECTNWVNNPTWNNQPNVATEMLEFTYCDTQTQGGCYLDITELYDEWRFEEVHGIMLKSHYESQTGMFKFKAETEDTIISPTYPTLIYVTKNFIGLEGYWSTHSQSVGESGTGYVSDYTRGLTYAYNDFAIGGEYASMGVTHYYNSAYHNTHYTGVFSHHGLIDSTLPLPVYSANYGNGWHLSGQQSVVLMTTAIQFSPQDAPVFYQKYVYVDADGTYHWFNSNSSDDIYGEFIDEDGLGLTLTADDTAEYEYIIKDKDNNQLLFNRDGTLAKMVDRNNNATTYTYDSAGKLTRITDASGRYVTLSYNGTNLTTLTDTAGRVTTYQYSTAYNSTTYSTTGNYLRKIIRPDGSYTEFSYNANGDLSRVYDSASDYSMNYANFDGEVTEYYEQTGDVDGKHIRVAEMQYASVFVDSGNDSDFYTDDEIETYYNFDRYGRTTSTYTEAEGTVYSAACEYTNGIADSVNAPNDVRKVNKIKTDTMTGGTSFNLLTNGSFERDLYGWTASLGSNCVGEINNRTSYNYFGTHSLKIGSSGTTAVTGKYDHTAVTLPAGKYTLSAYVKTVDFESSAGGAYIELGSNRSGYVSKTTSTQINDGWKRLTVSLTLSAQTTVFATVGISSSKGTAYFDGIQLETDSYGDYNLLENGSFDEGTYGWTNPEYVDSGSYQFVSSLSGRKNVLRIDGNPSLPRRVLSSQTNVTPSADYSYIVSGWAKANSSNGFNENGAAFAIDVVLKYTDNTDDTFRFKFNPVYTQWQNITGIAVPKQDKTVSQVYVYLIYDCNINSCYFDDICLTRGEASCYTYDENGNVSKVVSNSKNTTTMSYSGNNLTAVTDEDGTSTYTYDSNNNIKTAKSIGGLTTNYNYNENGTLSNANATDGNKKIYTSYGYSNSGNYITSVTDAYGGTTTSTYDESKGLLTSTTTGSYECELTTSYTYNNSNDLLTSVVAGYGNSAKTVNYSYNSKKQLSSITHNGFNYNFSYDEWGNTQNISVGTRLLSYSQIQQSTGNVLYSEYGNGWNKFYDYDNLGRVKTAYSYHMSSGSNYYINNYKYNKLGQLTEFYDSLSGVTSTFDYDAIGRLSSTLTSDGSLDINCSYDRKGRLYSTGYTGFGINNTYDYSYNDEGYLYGVHFSDNMFSVNDIDTFGRIKNNHLIDTGAAQVLISTAYTYSDGLLYNVDDDTTTLVDKENISGFGEFDYDYLTNGNIFWITVTRNGESDDVLYEYDEFGQLTSEQNRHTNQTVNYTYDAGGNITSRQTYDGVWWDFDESSLVTDTYTYGDSQWKDLLTAYNGQTITYDEIGNPITYKNGENMTWVGGRRLYEIDFDGHGDLLFFDYDSNGMRLRKYGPRVDKYNGTNYDDNLHYIDYYYDGDALIYERRSTYGDNQSELYTIEYVYGVNGIAGFRIHQGNTTTDYFYIKNILGDVLGVIDALGTLVAEYRYDAYGSPVMILDGNGNDVSANYAHIANVNPIRYRGYYYDIETGFYLTGTRYYDPEIGRFINADSLIDNRGIITQNLFQYCGNNPVNNADPSGNLFGAIVGIGLLVIGMVATLSGCSSKPAATTSTPSTPSKPSTPSSSTSSTTPPHIPTPQEKSYAATVYAEAGGQNKRSKQAVAHVMNNRIGTRSSWTDIESVISAKYQFDGYNSPMYQAAMNYYNNGICNNSIEQAAMDECLAVVIPIYSGAETDITGGALYFHSFPNPSDWAYHNSYTQVYVSGTEKFWFYK